MTLGRVTSSVIVSGTEHFSPGSTQAMNVRTVVLAALVAVLPAVALAEAEEEPRWSIGAGLGSTAFMSLPTPSSSSGGLLFLSGFGGELVPVATFFVERRIGGQTWLVFGGAGNFARDSFDPPPDTGTVTTFAALTQADSERFSVSAGLRRVVTRPGAVVEVSLQGTVEGGYLHSTQEFTTSAGVRSELRDTGGYGAVMGGIAVERALTSGLGLRISTPLVGASWSQLERRDESGTRNGSSTSVFVTLAPRLELRLAF
jgi:hypothetical protein